MSRRVVRLCCRRAPLRHRRLHLEPLEERRLLAIFADNGVSVDVDPETSPFVSSLDLARVRQISIEFGGPPAEVENRLFLHGQFGGTYDFSGFQVDGNMATWTLAEPVANDQLLVTLLDDGDSFQVRANVVPGDYNLDGIANAADYVVWRNKNNTGITEGARKSDGDGDGNGAVDQEDHSFWAANYGASFVALHDFAPVGTIGLADGTDVSTTPDVILALHALDDMTETANLQMAFSVDGANFSEFEPYQSTKMLTVPGGNGDKTVSVRFMDEAGLTADFDTTFTLDDEIETPEIQTFLHPDFEATMVGSTVLPYFGDVIAAADGRLAVGAKQDKTTGITICCGGFEVPHGTVFIYNSDADSPENGELITVLGHPHYLESYDPGPNNNENGAKYGEIIAVSENVALVGNPTEDIPEPGDPDFGGSVYVHDIDPDSPTVGDVLFELHNPNNDTAYITSGDFGEYMDMSGNIAVVGSRLDKSAGITESGKRYGAVYVFDLDPGNPTPADPIATLHHPDMEAAFPPGTSAPGIGAFGDNVKVAGNHVIVGVPWDESMGTTSAGNGYGAVYVYDIDPQSPTFEQVVATLVHPNYEVGYPPGDEAQEFGKYIELSEERVVVGMYRDRTTGTHDNGGGEPVGDGAVHVYDIASGSPTFGQHIATLAHPDYDTAFTSTLGVLQQTFGTSIAVSGDKVVVGVQRDKTFGLANDSSQGRGAVYVYDTEIGSPDFGDAIGSFSHPDFEAAYDDFDSDFDQAFGSFLSVRSDGVFVGAPADKSHGTRASDDLGYGAVYLFPFEFLFMGDGAAATLFNGDVRHIGGDVALAVVNGDVRYPILEREDVFEPTKSGGTESKPPLTLAVLNDSSTIDAGDDEFGNADGLDLDQRRFYRFADGDEDETAAVDIGAFELAFEADWGGV